MLFFEQRQLVSQTKIERFLKQQVAYYEQLRSFGKVLVSGDLYNQNRMFVIVNVSCDSELHEIIDNDPAIKQNTSELVRAMPFVAV